MDEYLKQLDGKRSITTILIACNGLSAIKVVRSIRKWQLDVFGNTGIIKLLTISTNDDLKCKSEHFRLVDDIIIIPDGPPNLNYGNIVLISNIAKSRNVDAIFSGWGHISENYKIHDYLDNKIKWIGPSKSAMYDLGDKIRSLLIAQSIGISCLPWSGSNVTIDYLNNGVTNSQFEAASIHNIKEARDAAEIIGYPVMIKASQGAGGRGIRKVFNYSDLEFAYEQVSKEIPNSSLFIVKYIPFCKHIEIQIVGDEKGNVLSLFSRECSVQINQSKIIEEAPALSIPPLLLLQMEDQARKLAQTVIYSGLGTIEYLYYLNNFYFLEINPRLQVEHPLTEMITDINLPALQLQISMGISLLNIPELQWLNNALLAKPKRHAISCRLTTRTDNCLENITGVIHNINYLSSFTSWAYFSIGHGGSINTYCDKQLGHVFASGESREFARKNLLNCINNIGEVVTNINSLRNAISSQNFINNDVDTTWFERQKLYINDYDDIGILLGSLCNGVDLINKKFENFLSLFNNHDFTNINSLVGNVYTAKLKYLFRNQIYHFVIHKINQDVFSISFNNVSIAYSISFYKQQSWSFFVTRLHDSEFLIKYHHYHWSCDLKYVSNGIIVTMNKNSIFLKSDEDLYKFLSPVSGRISRFLVNQNDFVEINTPFVEIQAMKMVSLLYTTSRGEIKLNFNIGDNINKDDVIAEIKENVPKSASIRDRNNRFLKPQLPEKNIHTNNFQVYTNTICSVYNMMKGQLEFSNDSLFSPKELLKLIVDKEFVDSLIVKICKACFNFVPVDILKNIAKALMFFTKFDSNKMDKFQIQLKKYFAIVLCKFSTIERKEYYPKIKDIFKLISNLNRNAFTYYFQSFVSKVSRSYLTSELIFSNMNIKPVLSAKFNTKEFVADMNLKLQNILIYIMAKNRNSKIRNSSLSNLANSSISHYFIKEKSDFLIECVKHLDNSNLEDYFKFHWRNLLMISKLNSGSLKDSKLLENIFCVENTKLICFTQQLTTLLLRFSILNSIFVSNGMLIGDYLSILTSFPSIHSTKLANLICELDEDLECLHDNSNIALLTYRERGGPSNYIIKTDDYFAIEGYIDFEYKIKEGIYCFENMGTVYRDKIVISFDLPLDCLNSLINDLKFICGTREIKLLLFSKLDLCILNKTIIEIINGSIEISNAAVFSVSIISSNSNFCKRNCIQFIKQNEKLVRDIDYNNLSIYFSSVGCSFSNKNVLNSTYLTSSTIFYEIKLDDNVVQNIHYINLKNVTEDSLFGYSDFKNMSLFKNWKLLLADAFYSFQNKSTKFFGINTILIKIEEPFTFQVEAFKEAVQILSMLYFPKLIQLNIKNIDVIAQNKSLETITFHSYCLADSTFLTFNTHIDSKIHPPPNSLELNLRFLMKYKRSLFHKGLDSNLINKMMRTHEIPLILHSVFIYNSLFTYLKHLLEYLKLYFLNDTTEKIEFSNMVTQNEIIVNQFGELEICNRDIVYCEIGAISWLFEINLGFGNLKHIVVLSNDATIKAGSFGVAESIFFTKIIEFATKNSYPLIYISNSSGARISIVESIQKLFNFDKNEDGSSYIWISEKSYLDQKSIRDSIKVKRIELICEGGVVEVRYVLLDILCSDGVENLHYCASMARAMSNAYKKIFTLTYACGPTVGIATYLARLSRRIIQKASQPILLTGSAVLNTILNKEAYLSNLQIGGEQIMHANGISDLVVIDDAEAVDAIIQWLFCSNVIIDTNINHRFSSLNTVGHHIKYTKSTSMVNLLSGFSSSETNFFQGFFDRNSFKEFMTHYAPTIITARARLGGIGVGVIAVENLDVNIFNTKDPAHVFESTIYKQSSSVIFANTAHKIANSIENFRLEGIPLIIFANFRGFAGGKKDMMDEVIKFGAMIINELTIYDQPVFVYLLPSTELLGGAWIVFDSNINPNYIETYVDNDSKAAILEADAIMAVKYKNSDILKLMHRLDHKLIDLDSKLNASQNFRSTGDLDSLKSEIVAREASIFQIYQKIILQFINLHDTPTTLNSKNVVSKIIKWSESSTFFYWRLRVRLIECHILKVHNYEYISIARSALKNYVFSLMPNIDWNDYNIVQFCYNNKEKVEAKFNIKI